MATTFQILGGTCYFVGSSMIMKLSIAILAFLAAVQLTSKCAAQSFDGDVRGIELVTQQFGGRAVFLFRFRGTVDGQTRRGIGIVGMNHTPLPDDNSGQAEILSGNGRLFVGFRSYAISNVAGAIAANPDGPFLLSIPLQFDITADMQIGADPHQFDGLLRHDTLPFSIAGGVQPN